MKERKLWKKTTPGSYYEIIWHKIALMPPKRATFHSLTNFTSICSPHIKNIAKKTKNTANCNKNGQNRFASVAVPDST